METAQATTQAEMVSRRPTPRLAPLIDSYLGYRLVGFPAGLHRGLPSQNATFIVSVGPEIDVVAQTDPTQTPNRYRCVLGGLQASPALIAHDGNQEGVAIELTPVGFRSLFGMPARALWNTSVELSDLAGPIGDELWERLQLAVTWEDRFAACDAVLSRIFVGDTVPADLAMSWRLLTESSGSLGVADLASTVGWSRQHFARRFKDEFGLSPKLAGRVMRFAKARDMLQSTPSFVSIAQVAASCGYYDQAHLARDFVDLAGCPPSQWMAEEELPNVQAVEEVEPG